MGLPLVAGISQFRCQGRSQQRRIWEIALETWNGLHPSKTEYITAMVSLEGGYDVSEQNVRNTVIRLRTFFKVMSENYQSRQLMTQLANGIPGFGDFGMSLTTGIQESKVYWVMVVMTTAHGYEVSLSDGKPDRARTDALRQITVETIFEATGEMLNVAYQETSNARAAFANALKFMEEWGMIQHQNMFAAIREESLDW